MQLILIKGTCHITNLQVNYKFVGKLQANYRYKAILESGDHVTKHCKSKTIQIVLFVDLNTPNGNLIAQDYIQALDTLD